MSPKILIVDDDPVQRQLLEGLIRRFGYAAETAAGGEAALARISAPRVEKIDLMILDLVMPDLDGMGVIGAMRGKACATPVIVQTTKASIEAAPSAMRAGAVDFIVKPAGPERLMAAIKNALRLTALEAEIRRLDRQAGGALSFNDIRSGPEMERVARLGERAAKAAQPVLLEGEAGVGKRAIAQTIRAASDRRGRPFVAVNCAGLPIDAIDRILFGCDKGAIAGERQPGKFVEAHGGALFLGEVGALPLAAQARLLRVLRDGEVDPIGAKRPLRVDVRVIAATTQNLIELVRARRFREDLYYRLHVHPISVPPLRQRRDEIAGLARGFCARFSAQEGKRLRGIAAEALHLLLAYDWPGNVRQLENAVFRAVALAEGDELTVAEFPQIAAQVQGFEVRIPAVPAPAFYQPQREAEAAPALFRDANVMALLDEDGDVRRLDQLEAEAIRFALIHYRGRMSAMARKLGIGRSTLYRKMKEYGVAFAPEEPIDSGEPGESGRQNAAA
jgi:DNA-binding NtrC family response regulator